MTQIEKQRHVMNHPGPMGLSDSALTDTVSISLAATDQSTAPLARAVTDRGISICEGLVEAL